jgi:hypothetical protein
MKILVKIYSQESLSDPLSYNYDTQNICVPLLVLTPALCKGKKTPGKWLQRKKEGFPLFHSNIL